MWNNFVEGVGVMEIMGMAKVPPNNPWNISFQGCKLQKWWNLYKLTTCLSTLIKE